MWPQRVVSNSEINGEEGGLGKGREEEGGRGAAACMAFARKRVILFVEDKKHDVQCNMMPSQQTPHHQHTLPPLALAMAPSLRREVGGRDPENLSSGEQCVFGSPIIPGGFPRPVLLCETWWRLYLHRNQLVEHYFSGNRESQNRNAAYL